MTEVRLTSDTSDGPKRQISRPRPRVVAPRDEFVFIQIFQGSMSLRAMLEAVIGLRKITGMKFARDAARTSRAISGAFLGLG